jgi:hypothetical protein
MFFVILLSVIVLCDLTLGAIVLCDVTLGTIVQGVILSNVS